MLYIIRHGKTDWNVRYKLQGNTDIPLNEEGRQQAREAAREYKDVRFDIAFCSPLGRAQETARILLAGRDIEIVTDERLREVGFGPYEGTERVFEHPESPIYSFFKDPEHYVAPAGAESFEELLGRTSAFLDEQVYPLLNKGVSVLIVAHGALNSALICNYKKRELKDFWRSGIPNCKLIVPDEEK